MDDPRSDDELMLAYRDGDAAAFETLYRRHREALYRYLLYASGDRSVADDLYQDVWTRIIDARHRYRARGRFVRYLFRTAHNRLVDANRRRARTPIMGDIDTSAAMATPATDAPERYADREQQRIALREALRALPRAQREAFILRMESDLSHAEIAAVTRSGTETVKSRIRYALTKLRRRLSQHGTEIEDRKV